MSNKNDTTTSIEHAIVVGAVVAAAYILADSVFRTESTDFRRYSVIKTITPTIH